MKPRTAPDIRKRELAQIHVAKSQLGIDDDTYRAMLWTVARVNSAADLDWAGRKKVIDHLKSKGFKIKSQRKPAKAASSRPMAQDPEAKKIRALWIFLHQLGAVHNPSEEALSSYVKRITKVDALQWINGYQAETLIESMKKWAMRFLPEQVKFLAQELVGAINSGELQLPPETIVDLRCTVATAQRRQTFDPMQTAWENLTNAMNKGGKP
jgi:phage gp16-like protein